MNPENAPTLQRLPVPPQWPSVSPSVPSARFPPSERLGLEVVLQRKGRVQDLMADSFAVARASLSASDRRLFEQWREANAQLAALMFRGPERMPVDKYRELLDQLKVKVESLEADLSHRSAEFRTQVETVTVDRIQRDDSGWRGVGRMVQIPSFQSNGEGQRSRAGASRAM